VPTHRSMIRRDLPDIVYKTEEAKFQAIANRVKELRVKGQPVLVGTVAIEKSEYLAALLERQGVPHQVLNAKNHEREATIIAGAGQRGSVTIATNMAGRGTDIKLGEGVRELGGLVIIGTERHEARRIDNQLRGRAGRQGDPGETQFYVSLEDELMRRFGGDKMKSIMTSLGLPDDEPIQNGIVSKTIESAQSKIEGFNFDIRKHVLEYDDVMNKQREVVYRRRKHALSVERFSDETLHLISEEFERMIAFHCVNEEATWNVETIATEANGLFPTLDEKVALKKLEAIRDDRSKTEAEKKSALKEYLVGEAKVVCISKERDFGAGLWQQIERALYIRSLDQLWMNHLDEIDYLRQGIGLRGYGQRDPLIEYKREAYDLFTLLLDSVRKTYLMTLLKLEPMGATPVAAVVQPQVNLEFRGADESVGQFAGAIPSGGSPAAEPIEQKPIVNTSTVNRNDPCPCGSGKKYKRCHGA